MTSPMAHAPSRPGARQGTGVVCAPSGAGLRSLLRAQLVALLIIGLGFLPGVMAPSRPFTPIVRMSESQGNQPPTEEDHPRTDAGLQLFAEKHRRAAGLFFVPGVKPCELAAFLASLQPVLARTSAPVRPTAVPDGLGIALRRKQLPRQGGPDEDPAA
jgi:hypothetical protein